MENNKDAVFLILGNQLFPEKHLQPYKSCDFFMAEDFELCTYPKHHKLKIALFLISMRKFAHQLKASGFRLTYQKLNKDNLHLSFEEKLKSFMGKRKRLISFEIEDKFFEERILKFCDSEGVSWEVISSPMFMCSREEFSAYLSEVRKPFMKTFYEHQRVAHNVMMDGKQPLGGQWSFDQENRKKLPKSLEVPEFQIHKVARDPDFSEVKDLIESHFSDHPGAVENFWLPLDRQGHLELLDQFLEKGLSNFGDYQDAISNRSAFLFHSSLSPGLNLGLITPDEVLRKSISYFHKHLGPESLNSLEGFVRQILGWREFVRGIYQNFSEIQDEENFFEHRRRLNSHWYEGTTGVLPLDDAIKKAVKYGYNHHIERLMVISNMMLLCEIDPREVHRWFMEMYVDSSDWVMGPNVYGMGQFSDGGIFATKPYFCGSNYILKMSSYKKGDPWCEIMDGLYWRFIERNKNFMSKNPRLNMMVKTLKKMDGARKSRIFKAAEEFLNRVTEEGHL